MKPIENERRFVKEKGKEIDSYSKVKVKQMGHIVEVKHVLKTSSGLENLLKLSKTEYLNKDTGEVLEYKINENRGQNIAGVKRSIGQLRDIINNNFTGGENELFVTTTYAENMTNVKQLYEDNKKFIMRLRYRYPYIEYINTVEPQGRGAWHNHILIKDITGKGLFIPHSELKELWGHGFVWINKLKDVDNIGAYLSAYLADIELTENNIKEIRERGGRQKFEIEEKEVKGETKAYLKGARLYLYPAGMNIYRQSKGIVKPDVTKMEYQDIKRIVGSDTPNYSRTITIYDGGDNVLNQITYEQYNLKRK